MCLCWIRAQTDNTAHPCLHTNTLTKVLRESTRDTADIQAIIPHHSVSAHLFAHQQNGTTSNVFKGYLNTKTETRWGHVRQRTNNTWIQLKQKTNKKTTPQTWRQIWQDKTRQTTRQGSQHSKQGSTWEYKQDRKWEGIQREWEQQLSLTSRRFSSFFFLFIFH